MLVCQIRERLKRVIPLFGVCFFNQKLLNIDISSAKLANHFRYLINLGPSISKFIHIYINR